MWKFPSLAEKGLWWGDWLVWLVFIKSCPDPSGKHKEIFRESQDLLVNCDRLFFHHKRHIENIAIKERRATYLSSQRQSWLYVDFPT